MQPLQPAACSAAGTNARAGSTRAGRGCVIELVGVAGSGKSRLAAEIYRALRRRGRIPKRRQTTEREPRSLRRLAAGLDGAVRLLASPGALYAGLQLARVIRPRRPAAALRLVWLYLQQCAVLLHLQARPGVHVLEHGMGQTLTQLKRLGPGGRRLPRYPRIIGRIPTAVVVVRLDITHRERHRRRIERDKDVNSRKRYTGDARRKRLRRLAVRLGSAGYERQDLHALLERFNQRFCAPPLPEQQVEAAVSLAARHAPEAGGYGEHGARVQPNGGPNRDPVREGERGKPGKVEFIPAVFSVRPDVRFLRMPNNTTEDLARIVHAVLRALEAKE